MYMIKTKVVSTDGLEPPITEPNSVVLPITPCAEKNSLLSRVRSLKSLKKNLQIIIYENTLVAAAGVEPVTFAL